MKTTKVQPVADPSAIHHDPHATNSVDKTGAPAKAGKSGGGFSEFIKKILCKKKGNKEAEIDFDELKKDLVMVNNVQTYFI